VKRTSLPSKPAQHVALEDRFEAEIRTRAYELYEQRGPEAGHELDDWLQAETELQRKAKAAGV
jgi:Protein of unknown function (DUF2934)